MLARPVACVAVAFAMVGCRSSGDDTPAAGQRRSVAGGSATGSTAGPTARTLAPDPYLEARLDMVARTIEARGITDRHVLTAMRLAPRHEFLPPDRRLEAYTDRPLPIGFGLSISQPFMVATMSEAARIRPGDRVLEIGTGSGYQAAVLALMGAKVYSLEIHEELGARTKTVLERTGFRDVKVKVADGWFGWEEAAPFDAILVTCATPAIPDRLLAQLKIGGRMIIPIGETEQTLEVIEKTNDGHERTELMDVRFGLMTGAVEYER